jgi:hypothetical protein
MMLNDAATASFEPVFSETLMVFRLSHTLDNGSAMQETLSSISNDNSLAILTVIAEQDTTGGESYTICKNMQLYS